MQPTFRRLAAAAVAAAGCASHVPPDPAQPATVASSEQSFSLNQGALHVSLRIPDAPPGRKPVLLSPFGDPEALLARGVIVASYEVDWERVRELLGAGAAPAPPPEEPPTDPGQRVGVWLLSSPRPGVVGRAYFQLIRANAEQNVPAVMDLLVTLPEVDPQRIAIAGSSTQGFVALQALRREPRLAAGVVRVACGDYLAFLRSSTLALADDPRWLPDGELPLDADYRADLLEHQPIAAPEAYPPRPLLVMAGRDDPVMPFACVEHTDAVFSEAYARAGVPERFQAEVLPGAGHDLGERSDELALAFIDRWLLAGAPR
jgi:pimeloyl-ACP methyl ester carboxylesterase